PDRRYRGAHRGLYHAHRPCRAPRRHRSAASHRRAGRLYRRAVPASGARARPARRLPRARAHRGDALRHRPSGSGGGSARPTRAAAAGVRDPALALAAAGAAAIRRGFHRHAHRAHHRAARAGAHAVSGRAAAPPAKRPRRRLRWLGVPAAILTLLFLLWLGGLAWFAHSIPDEVSDPTSATDAIVVLTGGSLRVQSGIALLNAGK